MVLLCEVDIFHCRQIYPVKFIYTVYQNESIRSRKIWGCLCSWYGPYVGVSSAEGAEGRRRFQRRQKPHPHDCRMWQTCPVTACRRRCHTNIGHLFFCSRLSLYVTQVKSTTGACSRFVAPLHWRDSNPQRPGLVQILALLSDVPAAVRPQNTWITTGFSLKLRPAVSLL